MVNQRISRIRRVWKWSVENELLPPPVLQGLQAVRGLQRDRTAARESEPVRPIAVALVEETLHYLSRHVAGLVRLLALTGMRCGEACLIRPCDIDMSGAVWLYRPTGHKMSYCGQGRTIALGPKAQAVIKEFWTLDTQAYLFSPARAREERFAALRAKRKTPVQPSQQCREKRNARRPGPRYTTRCVGHAIRKAIDRANRECSCDACQLLPLAERCQECGAKAIPHQCYGEGENICLDGIAAAVYVGCSGATIRNTTLRKELTPVPYKGKKRSPVEQIRTYHLSQLRLARERWQQHQASDRPIDRFTDSEGYRWIWVEDALRAYPDLRPHALDWWINRYCRWIVKKLDVIHLKVVGARGPERPFVREGELREIVAAMTANKPFERKADDDDAIPQPRASKIFGLTKEQLYRRHKYGCELLGGKKLWSKKYRITVSTGRFQWVRHYSKKEMKDIQKEIKRRQQLGILAESSPGSHLTWLRLPDTI